MAEPSGRDPDVLTTKELAVKLGLSPQTVRRMANAGQIPALKTGKDFRYSWAAVRDVLRRPHRPQGDSTLEDGSVGQQGAGQRARQRAERSVTGTTG
ncbi:hypothetical protein DPM19_34425 [Actinomadura craniellae]|uniref:Helix-turn-helix domain-containing protein n=1 Tax=Actinomadura craniellae TaxID=2231787 RepID=A0A365GV33_9ACTN|nr:helix-turn-helix domain-containing protein [Actinomadura craniellae]RAY10654.1 hypothetical protein DPM19_34425 [Actinomadura craniellae]